MILAWIILVLVAIFAILNLKKTVIIWIPVQLLFNSQIAIRYESPGISLVVAVDLLLICLYFLGVGKRGDVYNREPFILKPIFIASVVSFSLSLLFSSIFSLQGITSMVKYFSSGFILIAIFQKMIITKDDIRLFVKVTFIVALLITSLGIFESVFKDNPILNYIYFNSPHNETTSGRMFYIPPSISGGLSTRYGMVRAFSFFQLHIQFGVACVIMLFFYVVLQKKKWLVLKRPFMIFISIMLLAGVLAANSKTAYVAIIVFAFGLFSLREMFNWKILLPIIIIVFVIVTFIPQYLLNFSSLFDENIAEEGGGSTIALRYEQFETAKRMFMMNPILGNGLGSIEVLRKSNEFSRILGAESSWMRILPERGLLGALIYVYTFIYLFKILKKDMPKRLVLSFLLGIFVMETSTGLLDMIIYIPYLVVLRQMFKLEKMKKYQN